MTKKKENVYVGKIKKHNIKHLTYVKGKGYEGIIYKYTLNAPNTIDNGKVYIGCTIEEANRRSQFLSKRKTYAGEKINRAREKYGRDMYVYMVVEKLYHEDVDELETMCEAREKYYIALYDSENNGFNGNAGGTGRSGHKYTEQEIKQRTETRRNNGNNLHSEETKKKIKAHSHGTKLIAVSPDGKEREFDFITDAAKETGVPYSTMYNILNRGHKGEKWEYKFKKVV